MGDDHGLEKVPATQKEHRVLQERGGADCSTASADSMFCLLSVEIRVAFVLIHTTVPGCPDSSCIKGSSFWLSQALASSS